MAKFVMLSTLGPDGHARLRENPERLREVNADVEAMGVKVLEQYALLGQYDFLNILEAPDEKTMARVATTLSARGTLRTLTLTAIEVDDYIELMGGGVGNP
ncbi:MAG: GYD domain-containing protein [Acidimicrobiales bacterium]|nr:GYD domain-containing protein [Acidimicrobiales bacterium]